MPVYLHGLSLQFYRGIGPVVQRMAPFKDFNFFIGANNSGKSAVLKFISDHLPISPDNDYQKIKPDSLDTYRGKVTGNVLVEFAIPKQQFLEAALLPADQTYYQDLVEGVVNAFIEEKFVWFRRADIPDANIVAAKEINVEELANQFPAWHAWQDLWYQYTGRTGGDLVRHWIPEIVTAVQAAQNIDIPQTQIIPTMRQIGLKGTELNDLSGKGLIDRLAEIQNPSVNNRHEVETFNKINRFLQQVTDKPEAKIEIPHNLEHVLVHMDNKVLPLSSLETGIHEVIMIAAFCTIHE